MDELQSKYLARYIAAPEDSAEEDALLTIVSAFEQGGEDAVKWVALSRQATFHSIALGPLGNVLRLSDELRVYDEFLEEAGVMQYA